MTIDTCPDRLRVDAHDLELIRICRHHNPHGVFGWHRIGEASDDPYLAVVRTRQIGAEKVVLRMDGVGEIEMVNTGDDIFVAGLENADPHAYRLEVTWPGGFTTDLADAYNFLPTLGDMDLYLIGEGRHEHLWEVLGSHVRRYDSTMGDVDGVSFAVWAPNAKGVAVIGDFNGWNCTQHPMRSLGSSGVWEIFIPGVKKGATYKYAIHTPDARRDKADPMARRAETPPATGSIVCESSFTWSDDEWMDTRRTTDWQKKPMSVYEVHLGSWNLGEDYRDLAKDLVDYVKEMGYTHVEFMPVAEHPFGGSWGYQVSGYYAPSSRWGTPDGLRYLIDQFHRNGIGVLVDWVPAHFPKDDWALARFDGPALYEHPDWRRGEQTDWGTYVFDFGRREVKNFLVANALYWCEEFHVDGLRVDAVASMLYLDYSKKDGEWLPNQYGGREHLEAVQFLQEMNATVHRTFPGVLTVAEESTSWPGVTAPTDHNGLGFSMKWNMGWMNDTLSYFKEDPINRSWHHGEITFSMVYAYSEKFILPISHDEVVHGKGSLWTRMPGDAWNKAAGVRSLFGYMWAHPGKQLLFQGQEFAQKQEWGESRSLDWGDKEGWEGEYHRGVTELVKKLNAVYAATPALYTLDDKPEGFSWVKCDDAQGNVLAFIRHGSDGDKLLCVCNFGGMTHKGYNLGMPEAGTWELVLNTDAKEFEGAGNELAETVSTITYPWDNQDHSISIDIPAMSVQWYLKQA
ncbi:1,4-alpha-glucan branching protein GlgB [Corynebacterium mendelii]|uniref:1,4-alpha-glucan branching enzyme GlgB n=1 Tax=Corynebacterium mendelii TaxID=2765362 RepID=A0A939E100_9CORY|nr:1,4-alpha-glucan branching protein GlgB [Corynebacterium mendelii]MBN9644964.1 1,4-alpha-glucan branching protein GlgB [Corynebacterium mendelii]